MHFKMTKGKLYNDQKKIKILTFITGTICYNYKLTHCCVYIYISQNRALLLLL